MSDDTEPTPLNADDIDGPDVGTLEARVAELEAAVAERDAYIRELEADPYRPIQTSDHGDITPQLEYFHAQSDKAEKQAYERTYGTPSGDV